MPFKIKMAGAVATWPPHCHVLVTSYKGPNGKLNIGFVDFWKTSQAVQTVSTVTETIHQVCERVTVARTSRAFFRMEVAVRLHSISFQ